MSREDDNQELNDALETITTYRRRTELAYGRLKEEAVKQMNILNGFIPFVAPPLREEIQESTQIMSDRVSFLAESLNLVFTAWSTKVGPLLIKEGEFMINLVEELRAQLGEDIADKAINAAIKKIDSSITSS